MCPNPHACVCRPFLCPFAPIFGPRPAPKSLSAYGGFDRRGPLRIPCLSASMALCVAPILGIFWFLVSLSGARFRARVRVQGSSISWKSLAPIPPLHLLEDASAVRIPPPSLNPSPSTTFHIIAMWLCVLVHMLQTWLLACCGLGLENLR